MAENIAAPAAAAPKAQAGDPKANGTAPASAAPKLEEATETIKVNGKEVKLTRAQLVAAAQKGMFADQKLKSMDVLQGSTKALMESLKTPEGLLRILKDPALGNSPKEVFKKLMASDVVDDELKEEMSRWVYQNVVQKAKLSPEEIERDKKLSDYERLKKDDEDRKSQALSEQNKAQVNQVYQAVRAEVTKQILADKTFPQTEGSIRLVIDKLRVMNKQGAPITAETVTKAIEHSKKDHLLTQQTMFDAIQDPEALIAFFGEERALKISKALVARIQAKAKQKAVVDKKSEDGQDRESLDDSIGKRFKKDRHGYTVMEF